MALPILALAGTTFLLDKLGKNRDMVKQEVINEVNLENVTEVINENYDKTYITTTNEQDVRIFNCGANAHIGGGIIIDQFWNGDLNVYIASDQAMSAEALTELSAHISNQLQQTFNKLNTDLAQIIDVFSKGLEIDQTVSNIIDRVVRTTLNQKNFVDIVANSFNKQTVVIYNEGYIKGPIIVNQTAQLVVMTNTMVNASLLAVISDKAVIDWANNVSQDVDIKNIGPVAIIGIVLAIAAVIGIVVLGVYLSFMFKKPGEASKLVSQPPPTTSSIA